MNRRIIHPELLFEVHPNPELNMIFQAYIAAASTKSDGKFEQFNVNHLDALEALRKNLGVSKEEFLKIKEDLKGNLEANLEKAKKEGIKLEGYLDFNKIEEDARRKTFKYGQKGRKAIPQEVADQMISNISIGGNASDFVPWLYCVSEKEKIELYQTSKPFFKALSNLKRGIPLNKINTQKIWYFIFPEGFQLLTKEGIKEYGQLVGCYVFFEKGHEAFAEENPGYSMNLIFDGGFAPKLEDNEYLTCIIKKFLLREENGLIKFDKTTREYMSEGMDEQFQKLGLADVNYSVDLNKYFDHDSIETLNTFLLNAHLYSESEDAVIDALKPAPRKSPKGPFKNKYFKYKGENQFPLPVKRLYWDYKGKEYSKESTTVDTHLRWQPCGPQKSQVKLIWVKEHTRSYKKAAKSAKI